MSSNGIQRGSGEAREVDGEPAAGGSTHGAAAGDGLPVMPRAEHPPIPGQPAPATRTPTPARRVEPVSGDGSPAGAVSRDGSPASAARHFAEPVAGHPADLVVVGVDGSLGSGDAVDWAAQQAARRHATLRLVHANTVPVVGEAAHRRSAEDVDRPPRVVGQALLEEVRAGLRGSDPALGVETRLVPGDPVTVLRGESEHARLTVVGALGAGRAAGRLLGSVAVAISDLNSAPVAVIHPHHRNAGRGPVVVGVDGSPASDAAVEFAFEEAAMRRADLLAVHAWHDEAVDTTVGDHRRFTDPDHTEETERALLSERLAGWSSRNPDVVVHQTVVRGRSAPALLEFGNDAQLVAVGSRGRGFSGRLLGSTGHALITHSECPVVVVRPHSLL